MTLGSHQRTIGHSQVHLTPRRILDPLGRFDLDPCGNAVRPWDCARVTFTEADDGLAQDWFGRVWLNPPFDTRQIALWLEKMARHDCGIALVHARTDTQWFKVIRSAASGLLFLEGRVIFHKADGSQQTTRDGKVANSGAPVLLAAYGAADLDALADSGLDGMLTPLRLPRGVVVMALGGSWRQVVSAWLADQRGPVSVEDVWRALRNHAKSQGRRFAREQIRKVLQLGAGRRVGPDQWVAA